MLPIEQAHGDALVALARARFDPDLRVIEEQVLRHSCAYEDPPDWIADPDAPDPTRDPDTGRPLPGWRGPELRPALLRWLLTDSEATALLEPRGLRVWNARLTDPLDLTGCRIPARLELRYCLVEAPILLTNAELTSFHLRNSILQQTLGAPFLKLHGTLSLDDIIAAKTLNFDAANLRGEVRIANSTLTATDNALTMAGASIANDLIFYPHFQSAGHLYLKGIHVGGFVGLPNAKLTTTATAMTLDNARVDGDVYLNGEFTSAGEIHILIAHIGGQLNCEAATLTAIGNALWTDGATISGGVFLCRGFNSSGEIRMMSAKIDSLDCEGATLTAIRDALSLDGAIVSGSIFLNNGFNSTGNIRMTEIVINGQLNCKKSKIKTKRAGLLLHNATIGHNVFLDENFECVGT